MVTFLKSYLLTVENYKEYKYILLSLDYNPPVAILVSDTIQFTKRTALAPLI